MSAGNESSASIPFIPVRVAPLLLEGFPDNYKMSRIDEWNKQRGGYNANIDNSVYDPVTKKTPHRYKLVRIATEKGGEIPCALPISSYRAQS